MSFLQLSIVMVFLSFTSSIVNASDHSCIEIELGNEEIDRVEWNLDWKFQGKFQTHDHSFSYVIRPFPCRGNDKHIFGSFPIPEETIRINIFFPSLFSKERWKKIHCVFFDKNNEKTTASFYTETLSDKDNLFFVKHHSDFSGRVDVLDYKNQNILTLTMNPVSFDSVNSFFLKYSKDLDLEYWIESADSEINQTHVYTLIDGSDVLAKKIHRNKDLFMLLKAANLDQQSTFSVLVTDLIKKIFLLRNRI